MEKLKDKEEIIQAILGDKITVELAKNLLTQTESNETYLFFDTETTGLPRDWNASVNDVDNWPRIVQISWVVYKNSTKISSSDFIIKPEGFRIPIESSNVHGITTERAEKEGVSLQAVLTEFQNLIEQADFIIAHNISFDEKIVGAEFIRKNMSDSLESKKTICTMKKSTNFCAIPSSNGYNDYKWPKLSELYIKLFDTEFEDAHNSLADVNATAKCFWEMKKRGIL
ncbi:3'-5' exonuclease [Candidatus Parcubacteria bacterium]|nr:3'-5' exonuclease [Candidatus Parcubacteria bacterium]